MTKLSYYIAKGLLFLAIISTLLSLFDIKPSQRISYQAFEEMAVNGDIDKVIIDNNSMTIYPYEGNKTYITAFVQDVEILKLLDEQEIIVDTKNPYLISIALFAVSILYAFTFIISYTLPHHSQKVVLKEGHGIEAKGKSDNKTAKKVLNPTFKKSEIKAEEEKSTNQTDGIIIPEQNIAIVPVPEAMLQQPEKGSLEEKPAENTQEKKSSKLFKRREKTEVVEEAPTSKEPVVVEDKIEDKKEPEELDFSTETVPPPPVVLEENIIEAYFEEPVIAMEEPPEPEIEIISEAGTPDGINEKENPVLKNVVPAGEKRKPVLEVPKPLKKTLEKDKKTNKQPEKESASPHEPLKENKKTETPKTEQAKPKASVNVLNEDDY